MRCIIDLEANGLLPTPLQPEGLTKLWCACAYNIDTGVYNEFDLKDGNYEPFKAYLDEVEIFIGHHILGYDIDAIDLITGYHYDGGVLDTLIYSRTLNPDRKIPVGCPTHTPDPITGKMKIVGAHGLEAWGYRVDNKKPFIDRWDVYTPKIPIRCKEDVRINYLTLLALLEEAGLNELVSI